MKNIPNIIKRLFLVTALVFSSTMISFGQDSNSYKTSLKEMMDASGSAATYKVAIVQTIKMLKSQKNDVPESVWQDFEATFLKSAQDELFDLLLPIYQKT